MFCLSTFLRRRTTCYSLEDNYITQQYEHNLINNIIKRCFRLQLKTKENHMYKKPCPKWVNRLILLLKGYKDLYFATFFRENDKSTMPYIGRFTSYCGRKNQKKKFHEYYLFPLSLRGTMFMLYFYLPPNLIHKWVEMETCFMKNFICLNLKSLNTNL